MEIQKRINDWFSNGEPYQEGVSIYNEIGKSPVLKKLFSKSATKKNKDKLSYELGKLRNAKPVTVKKKKKVVKKVVKSTPTTPTTKNTTTRQTFTNPKRYGELSITKVEFEELPEQLKYEWHQRIKLFKEADRLHFTLDRLTEDEAEKAVTTILENWREIERLWSRIDYWKKHGIIPPDNIDKKKIVKDLDKLNLFELSKRLSNIRSNLSKGKKKLFALRDNNKIALLNEKMAKWEIEKADIEKKLQAHG